MRYISVSVAATRGLGRGRLICRDKSGIDHSDASGVLVPVLVLVLVPVPGVKHGALPLTLTLPLPVPRPKQV